MVTRFRACLPLLVPSLGLALLGESDEREGRGGGFPIVIHPSTAAPFPTT